MESDKRKETGEPTPSPEGIAGYLVARMAQRGRTLVLAMREELGDVEPKSGHVVDGLMKEATRFEGALLARRFGDAVDAAVCVLFLARDLAIREGKIRVEPIKNPNN